MAAATTASNGLPKRSTSEDASSDYVVPLTIAGEEVQTSKTFAVTGPSSGKIVWTASSASVDDAIAAAASAQEAFSAWSRTTSSHRRDIFLRAADIIDRRRHELAEYMQAETGSEAAFSAGFNVPLSAEILRDVAGRISSIQGSIPSCSEEGRNALIFKEPYGVVLGLAPWNAPYILGFRAVAYALAAGNTAVLKGSELSPRCFWAVASVFGEAGLPAGALNVIASRREDAAEVTTALIVHPSIKKINFTGSTAIGSLISQTAGKHLKPVVMELGGKASAIVLRDANLKTAAHECALGAFLHSGQICMSTERILVDSTVVEEFSGYLKTAVRDIFGSDSAQVLVSPAAAQRSARLVENAKSLGAKILTGSLVGDEASSARMRPIVVENVSKDMDLYYTESFGPSVSLLTFDTETEAIDIANDTEYGLSASVFTESLSRGLNVARQIESGAVHINGMTVHDEPNLPHGGTKQSGFGRFGGSWGLDEFLRTKTVTFKV
ncbi:MAG: hypothetical protein M1837_001921 [Sclerophora amabilis]|nr:MAG: hypothetical protein M1837_001921 [Sclerophora amabilis]